jgi:hypothetical protein
MRTHSAARASPQLLGMPRLLGIASAACFGAPLARPRLCVYPSCLHLPGAGVPTQGTSRWGHPLGESNGTEGRESPGGISAVELLHLVPGTGRSFGGIVTPRAVNRRWIGEAVRGLYQSDSSCY